MITGADILRARTQIETGFRRAAGGPATKRVEEADSDAAAVGQYMQGSTVQRGIHGTAAAIQVLAQAPDKESAEFTKRLVHYVEHRDEIEGSLADIKPDWLDENSRNIIKTAETLYALHHVSTGIARREDLTRQLADRLISGRLDSGGWGYYLDGDTEPRDLLPTSFAVLALDSHGYDVQDDLDYMRQQLNAAASHQTDVSVQMMALYVLCFRQNAGTPDKEIKTAFERLWTQLAPLLGQNLEANIEYIDYRQAGSSARYVRVPWQLYILACAAKLAPYRRFASKSAQSRLRDIIDQVVKNGGLIYPHSGSVLSTRTNAILFETLGNIGQEMSIRHLPLSPFEAVDRARTSLSSRVAVYGVRAIVLVVVAIAVAQWFHRKDHGLAELTPELLSSGLLLLLTAKRDV
jgi:hypothetical protein